MSKINIIKRIFHTKKCPICGNCFNEFLLTGTDASVWKRLHGVGGGLRHAICPHCGSSDRERLVYLFLKDKYLPQIQQRVKLLHIAPEVQLSFFLRNQSNLDYLAADKRCEGYSYPDDVIDIDIMSMPEIDDNSFDIIICNHVLEHVPNDIVAMKELCRILNPTGIAILQVPMALDLMETLEDPSAITPEDRLALFGQSDHVRLYGIDYPERLKKAGFKVEVNNMAMNYNKKLGLNKEEKLYICRK